MIPNVNGDVNDIYFHNDNDETYPKAKSYCEDNGGRLATFKDQREYDALMEFIGNLSSSKIPIMRKTTFLCR